MKGSAFWDASALVPLCVDEPTSKQAAALAMLYTQVVWWATEVEVHSSIARLQRMGQLSDSENQRARIRCGNLSQDWLEIPPSVQVRKDAQRLIRDYPLRAADSLQLAAAWIWCDRMPQDQPFFTADLRLSEAARAVGFQVTLLR